MTRALSRPISRRRFLRQVVVAGAATTLVWRFPHPAAAAADRRFSGYVVLPEGFTVPAGEVWEFDPDTSTTVVVEANVVVLGVLRMRPSSAAVRHTLKFSGIDESRFVGGGMAVRGSDVGLWVREAGRLDLRGTPKQAWNTTGWAGSWQTTDEVRIAPTARGDHGTGGFARYRRGDRVPVVRLPGGVPTSFHDTRGHTFHDDIEALVAAGVAHGFPDQTFRPNDRITRAQMAVMLANAFELGSARSAGFRDTRGHWAERWIDRVAAAGYVEGYPDGRFRPDSPITRAEIAAVLARALGLERARSQGFLDTRGHWAERVIDSVAAAGIMGRTGDGRFRPNERGTRGQVAAVLQRALHLRVPGLVSPTGKGSFPAEVLNLTRNVHISGSPGRRAHINITSTEPQVLKHVRIRQMGPRRPTGEKDFTEGVVGRYPLHFHHCGHGSRGSLVEGVVVVQSGHRAFVAHDSHGVTFRDCIAYDVFDTPYWWDDEPGTDDTRYERCVAAYVRTDPEFRGHRLAGFSLSKGRRNVAVDCVAVGVQGTKNASGFHWPEKSHGLWEFTDCTAHNNTTNGIFVWQNTSDPHRITRFTAYRNGQYGIEQGAYSNSYVYDRALLIDNAAGGVLLHAVSRRGGPIVVKRSLVHGRTSVRTARHRVDHRTQTVFRDTTFVGHGGRAVVLDNHRSFPDRLTFRTCKGVGPREVVRVSDHPGTNIVFQP